MTKRTKYWMAAIVALLLAFVVPPTVTRDPRDLALLFFLLVSSAILFGLTLLASLKEDERDLKPSMSRVRLDPASRPSIADIRGLVPSSDGSIELPVRGTTWWWLVWIGFYVLIAVLIALDVGPYLVVAISICYLLIVLVAARADERLRLTGVWRFGPGRVTRQPRLPLPTRIWPRHFPDVIEFEIVHTLYTLDYPRRQHGGHSDILIFRARGVSRPVTVMARASSSGSWARLRGDAFTQDQASEIEREILPAVLAVAQVASQTVGAPLYVTEKTFWIGLGPD